MMKFLFLIFLFFAKEEIADHRCAICGDKEENFRNWFICKCHAWVHEECYAEFPCPNCKKVNP